MYVTGNLCDWSPLLNMTYYHFTCKWILLCVTDVKKGLAGVGLISIDDRIGVPLLEKGKHACKRCSY